MTNMTTQELLDHDPIQAVEDLTGKHYTTDDGTIALSLLHAIDHNKAKEDHLKMLGDTTLRNKLERYQSIITDIGFEQVLAVPFIGNDSQCETFFVYADRQRGILLTFDTYRSDNVNGGNFYYCWVPDKDKCKADNVNPTSSGGFHTLSGDSITGDTPWTDLYWAGHHDCREAIRYHISQLEGYGKFLPVWPANNDMFLWLLHYMDTKVPDYDYKAINSERIKMLPDWVQKMINVDPNR